VKFASYLGGMLLKNKIREYRLKKGMTQQQLAEAVHVSTRTIISLEQGKYNPSLMLAYRLAVLFGTTIEDLYCLEENMKEEDKKYENKK
jgi:putative transcriptional regulator